MLPSRVRSMNNANRPPSPTRFHRPTSEIQKGKINNYDLLYSFQDNPFCKTQLDALLRTPVKKTAYDKQQQKKAHAEALRRLTQTLRRTCHRRRDHLYLQCQLHHNGHYLRLLRLKRNELEKQNKWDKFVMDVITFRITQAHRWINRKHSKWMSNVIHNSNPFELAQHWPEGSRCTIDPLMSPYWVTLKPPLPPTTIEVEASIRKHFRNYESALEAAYYKTLGMTKNKSTATKTDTN